MIWLFKSFSELSVIELYAILKGREAVFSQEQRCSDPDLDDHDQTSFHLFCLKSNEVLAYARFFAEDDYVSMGRVFVHRSYRCRGLGQELIQKVLNKIALRFPNKKLVISAQAYLEDFYQNHGFKTLGEPYKEAGITHIRMEK
jgi:ElaA protein